MIVNFQISKMIVICVCVQSIHSSYKLIEITNIFPVTYYFSNIVNFIDLGDSFAMVKNFASFSEFLYDYFQ